MELISLTMTDDLNALREALELKYRQACATGKVERNTDRIAREILRMSTDAPELLTVQDVVSSIMQDLDDSSPFGKDEWETFVQNVANALTTHDPVDTLRGVWKMDQAS